MIAVPAFLKTTNMAVSKTTIAPMLSVRHGAMAVEFYKAAFGTTELFRIDDANGAVVAHLSANGAEFWVADESPEHANFSPETLGGGSVRMIMTVDSPDSAFNQAVAAGAKVISPIAEEYGWRLGRVVDPYGHHWEIGKPLPQNS
jgi:PhnB protein